MDAKAGGAAFLSPRGSPLGPGHLKSVLSPVPPNERCWASTPSGGVWSFNGMAPSQPRTILEDWSDHLEIKGGKFTSYHQHDYPRGGEAVEELQRLYSECRYAV